MRFLSSWHQTRLGMGIFGAIELAIAYIFASLAIDRGSWWWYALTLIFLVGAIHNVIKLVGKFLHAKGRRTR